MVLYLPQMIRAARSIFPKSEFEIYSGYRILQPVYYGTFEKPGISAEILEFRDPGGTDRTVSADRGIAGVLWIRQVLGEAEVIGIFLLCDIDVDAVPGNTGTQLSGGGKAEHTKYVLGHLAARNLFTFCSLSADEVHEENSCGSHGSGTDRRCRRVADLSADLHAVVQRSAVFRGHPCIYRLLEYGGTAVDPVIRCGDASIVRIFE